jgi:uncharacterized protein YutE (UPF0331/DUF86 family)
MLNPNVIQKRLLKLTEYLDILKDLSRYKESEFLTDPEIYGSAERFLQLTIEAFNDIGSHIISGKNLGTVNWYRDIPEILFEKGYLSEEQKNEWIKMIGFRNALVHDYMDIDRKIVYEILHSKPAVFEEFLKIFAKVL